LLILVPLIHISTVSPAADLRSCLRMRVKICGITELEDAEAAVAAGAWAIGLNFVHDSPRCVPDPYAEMVGAAIKRRAEVAGVFANASLGRIAALAERCELTLVQLHGDEGPSFCREVARRTGCKVIKAFRVRSSAEVRGASAYRTDFHLFDAYRPGTRGGTGESFDWDLVGHRSTGIPAIVAGGLTPDNVGEAIAISRPYAVDVAGGVEDGIPGRKDHDLIRRFMASANAAEGERTPA
jgi:phosphoribosylanthranilate isomerase